MQIKSFFPPLNSFFLPLNTHPLFYFPIFFALGIYHSSFTSNYFPSIIIFSCIAIFSFICHFLTHASIVLTLLLPLSFIVGHIQYKNQIDRQKQFYTEYQDILCNIQGAI